MEPPIPSGTVLQNRYHVISVLGQGGFGRTYLAEDQGRFNEPCALKELIPPQTEDYTLQKSKELFQREASTLYQIKHPQIPQFRATFEQDGRLFLVQDYVEGKTYRELLNERKAHTVIQPSSPANVGSPDPATAGLFSETEVRQLLLQLLPMLDHLHSRGIIHRDITPDNIILRNTDHMPVLIDFGVVKELATRILATNASAPVTTVGKVGYAPSEQIQTGRAYPSSDLYSLAVSAIVLLTGKEPQAIYDDQLQTWNWRRWANVSDEFATVLDRMLSYRPSDRYQSAPEVMQALQSGPSIPQAPISRPTTDRQPDPNLSQVATMAVGGRRPDPETPTPTTLGRSDRSIPDPGRSTLLDNPWAVVGIGAALALTAGLGSWALVSSLNRQNDPIADSPTAPVTESPEPIPTETLEPTPTPTTTPSPKPTATTTPSPKPTITPTPRPTAYSQRLDLDVGQAITRAGNLKANTTVSYIFSGEQGQRLRASIAGEGALMTLVGPDESPVNNQARRVTQWQGRLPFTGDYTIQLSPVKGLQGSDYKLALSLTAPPKPSPSPTTTTSPSPSPSPTGSPGYDTESISVPTAGSNPLALVGQSSPQKIKRYQVNVQQGQQFQVAVKDGNVAVDIRDPNGQVIEAGVKFWSSPAPAASSGQYQVDVIAQNQNPTSYTLNISSGQ
ncbi:MAG: serine/threonine protein kinase [Coleofasciculus sp. Co-bin14]|nr:serine/threonine protein kinase [Coleofasciculus sp. Co-bin14]